MGSAEQGGLHRRGTDEVHALDQLAQLCAQIFAGVALQGLLQVFG